MKNPLRTLLAGLGIGPRIVLIFALVFSGMGGLGLVLMRNSLIPTFERMESEMALDSSWRVVKTFEQLMSAPAELSNDWALWDDMYFHIQRPNKEFASSNYSDEVLTTAKYHAVLILDREKKLWDSVLGH